MTSDKVCKACSAELMHDVCEECGGDGGTGMSNCCDDLCNGNEVPCMHGDYAEYRCDTCGGKGGWDWCPSCLAKEQTQEVCSHVFKDYQCEKCGKGQDLSSDRSKTL